MPSDAAFPPPASVSKNSGRKMHKMLKSAFKRADSPGLSAASGDEPELSPSASVGSSASSGSRASSGKRVGRGSRSDDVGDRSSRESFELDGSKNEKMVALAALRDAKIASAYEPFPWDRKMRELLPVPDSSRFLSLLLLPKATDGTHTRYSSLDDTLARADAWLASSRSSGVPVQLASVQTEALLTKISGETAVSTVNTLSDLANMSNVSLYGFEDYHGVDIGLVRAVRLWYAPSGAGGETAVEIALRQGDTRLGFAISRTEEGFIYVSSVADESTPGVASTRSGLLELHRAARRAGKLLVVSRVGGEKVLPWLVSTAGDVRCFDTVSLSQKLSLHRHALRPITLHFLAWDDGVLPPPPQPPRSPVLMMSPPSAESDAEELDGDGDGPGIEAGRGGPKGSSFRFQNIGLPDSWM
ncbi:uncharacterized protein LOC124656620 [Lolium rigidum]|uniref:uncharacterized protein LOC124656620 n=1 Tax=Lolium rigidum TaxID=89674 RepID=UPI001F5C7CC4|nr:uncharacterized protein LOC124656620 [Lolium rigidum]